MIKLAKQIVCLGISNMIYDRPSEMVPEHFFFFTFLQLQASKTYSGISIQHTTY